MYVTSLLMYLFNVLFIVMELMLKNKTLVLCIFSCNPSHTNSNGLRKHSLILILCWHSGLTLLCKWILIEQILVKICWVFFISLKGGRETLQLRFITFSCSSQLYRLQFLTTWFLLAIFVCNSEKTFLFLNIYMLSLIHI